jgi:hypothetical protein
VRSTPVAFSAADRVARDERWRHVEGTGLPVLPRRHPAHTCALVDDTVLETVAPDLSSRNFAKRILKRVKANSGAQQLTEAQKLRT